MKRSFFIALGLYVLLFAALMRLQLPRVASPKSIDVSSLRIIKKECTCKVCKCKNCVAHTTKPKSAPPKNTQHTQTIAKAKLPKTARAQHRSKPKRVHRPKKKRHKKHKKVVSSKPKVTHTKTTAVASTLKKEVHPAAAAPSVPSTPSTQHVAATQQKSAPASVNPQRLRNYLATIRAIVMRHRRYPRIARRLRYEGVVKLRFIITKDGTLHGLKILTSSNHAILDNAALATLKEAAKEFPPPPKKIEVVLPLEYRLR